MFSLADATNNKKKSCKKHVFELKYPHGSKRPIEVCGRCRTTRIYKVKNQTLNSYITKPSSTKSILAYQQSIVLAGVVALVTKWISSTNWNDIRYDGFKFPATGRQYSWCGIWHTLACLNYRLHEKLGKGKRIYVKSFVKSCYRASCSICYVKWIIREANSATKRFERYIEKHPEKKNQKPIHLILLPPPSQYDLGYDMLKSRMMKILKTAQWGGGAAIFHPFAPDEKDKGWEKRPHFHLVGFGTPSKIAKAYGMHGWYLKNCGERESLFKTFCYLLSHCGIKKGTHSVIWIGALSYRKLKVQKEKKVTCCTVCSGKFIPVAYDGTHPIVTPGRHFEGLVDYDERWHPVDGNLISSSK